MNAFVAVDNPTILERHMKGAGRRFTAPLSALIATNYFGKLVDRLFKMKENGDLAKLFLDSGTFTRNQEGMGSSDDHEFEPYMDTVQLYGHHFDWIAAYDLDFKDPKRNQDFYREMLIRLKGSGLEGRVVPVVHDAVNGADEFDLYASMGAECIAIGSTPPLAVDQWKLINRIRFWKGISIHIMGNLGTDLLKARKPESADSARYAHEASFGNICYWNPRTKNLEHVYVLNRDEFTDEIREFIMTTFGFTPSDLMADVYNKWLVNLYGIHQMQEFLTNEWYPQNEVADW